MPSLLLRRAALALSVLSLSALAQVAAPPATAPSAAEAGSAPTLGPDMQSRMATHMQAMQALRERMLSASTPAQKEALMAEHLRLMDEQMDWMQTLMKRPGGPAPAGPGMPMGPMAPSPMTPSPGSPPDMPRPGGAGSVR